MGSKGLQGPGGSTRRVELAGCGGCAPALGDTPLRLSAPRPDPWTGQLAPHSRSNRKRSGGGKVGSGLEMKIRQEGVTEIPLV